MELLLLLLLLLLFLLLLLLSASSLLYKYPGKSPRKMGTLGQHKAHFSHICPRALFHIRLLVFTQLKPDEYFLT